MSVKLTRTFTRPSTTVSFWAASPETKAQIDAAYVATGKLLSVVRHVPESTSLTQVIEYVFSSVETLDEFATDPALFAVVQERDTYNEAHGITNTHVVEQVA
jgi:hypothetical protein